MGVVRRPAPRFTYPELTEIRGPQRHAERVAIRSLLPL